MPVPAMKGLTPDDLSDSALIVKVPNDQFWLVHDPTGGWEVGMIKGEPYILPTLGNFFLTPGVGMVHSLKEGQPRDMIWQDAIAAQRARGVTMLDPKEPIPAEFLPEHLKGARRQGFLGSYPCHFPRTGKKGNFHCLIWETPAEGLPNEETRLILDADLFNAWRLHLYTSGQVRPIYAPALARLQRSRASAVQRIKDRAGLTSEERASYLAGPAARHDEMIKAVANLDKLKAAA